MSNEERIFSVNPKGITEQVNMSTEEFKKKEKEAKIFAENTHLEKIKVWGNRHFPEFNEKEVLKMFKSIENKIYEKHRLEALKEIDEELDS